MNSQGKYCEGKRRLDYLGQGLSSESHDVQYTTGTRDLKKNMAVLSSNSGELLKVL